MLLGLWSAALYADNSALKVMQELTVCKAGCQFTTIQAANDDERTRAGDTILIKDTIHTEGGITLGKSIKIIGDTIPGTIVQAHTQPGKAGDRVFQIQERAEVTLENLTIRHGKPKGYPSSGGGISNLGSLTLINVLVIENLARTSGGGIWNKGTLTILNSKISRNYAERAGPIGKACGAGGGIQNEKGGVLVIENSEISYNTSDSRGGGLFISCDTKAIIKNSNITHNKSTKEGGGISVMGELEMYNSNISHNSVGGLANFGKLSFQNNSIENNTISSDMSNFCKIGKCGTIQLNTNNNIGTANFE